MPLPGALTPARALAAVALVVSVAGCGAGEPEAAPAPERVVFTADPDVPVLEPGRPGEPAATVAPGGEGSYEDATRPGEADGTFVRDMVVHHRQALAMAGLAPERAGSDAVRRLAERIAAAQGPEIAAMEAWLAAEGLPPAPAGPGAHDSGQGDHDAHGGGPAAAPATPAMPGMAAAADLAELEASRGADFDRRFLDLMVAHHQGALAMAGVTGARAESVAVQDLVADVVATQTVEIDRMRELRTEV